MDQPPLPSAWLVSNGRVLASADIANTGRSRRHGLIGKSSIDTALVISPCRWIHTVGMKCPIDAIYIDGEGRILKMEHIVPRRIAARVPKARTVVELPSGSIAKWELSVGDVVEVRAT